MRLAMLAAAAAALLARLLTGPHPVDDAYITFRYARNLADGFGLTYNPGEWVLGTTTPLWAILLAAAYRLGAHDLPWVATALSSLFDALSAAVVVWLVSSWPNGRVLGSAAGGAPGQAADRLLGSAAGVALLAGLAFAINPLSVSFAVGGMETSLFVLLALAALGLAGPRPVLGAVLAGLDTLVRPEGALVALAIVVWLLVRRSRASVPAALAASTPVAAGAAMAFALYGSPLPNTVAAKQVAYVPNGQFDNVAALALQAGLPGFSTYLLAVIPTGPALILALAGLATLIILVRKGQSWRTLRLQPYALFGLLYLAFYTLAGLRGVRLFPWYLVPLVPLYTLGAAKGLSSLKPWAILGLLLWQLPAIDWRQPFLPAGFDLQREQVLYQVGTSLAETLPSTAVVAAPEIGALGYASNLRMLDTVGLVSPTSLRYYPLPTEQLVSDNAIPARLIEDQQPDAVVALDEFARGSLMRDAAFVRDYQLASSYPLSMWESSNLWVFRRVSP